MNPPQKGKALMNKDKALYHYLYVQLSAFGAVVVLVALIFCTSSAAWALGQDALDQGTPIEVTADKELEWDRNAQTYIARGSAKAVQGENSLEGDVLKAYYASGEGADEGGNTDITKIEAFDNVIIKSDGNTALGDRGSYDLTTGQAVLTGGNLMLVTPQETITARDRITFNSLTNIMTAEGAAKIEQGTDTLESDMFKAYFENRDGQRVLKEMEALGNVIITTPDEVLTGDRGKYVASTDTASVYGNVKIIRGENILTGDRAQFNLTTRKSKMFAGQASSGESADGKKKDRVRAIFYPE